MGKKTKTLTLDEWIEALNPTTDSDIIAYGDEFFKKLSKKAFKELVYRNTFNRLANIVMKTFKWTVPDTINARVIESGLLWRSWLCIYDKPGIGKLCLPCTPTNVWTIYGEPTQVNVYGFNGYTEWVNIDQPFETPLPPGMVKSGTNTKCHGIVMRDNDRAYPYINYVKEYAYKITDKIIALHIATQRLKSPFTYVVDEKELKDTIEQLANKIESNEDVIIRLKANATKESNQDSIRLEKNDMRPELIKAIKESIIFDFDMFLETIGINTNPTPDKSQYVNDQEIGSNNGLIELSQDIRLDNRKKFCKDAKALGVNISVKFNVKEMTQEINKFKNEVKGEGNDTNKKPTSDK